MKNLLATTLIAGIVAISGTSIASAHWFSHAQPASWQDVHNEKCHQGPIQRRYLSFCRQTSQVRYNYNNYQNSMYGYYGEPIISFQFGDFRNPRHGQHHQHQHHNWNSDRLNDDSWMNDY